MSSAPVILAQGTKLQISKAAHTDLATPPTDLVDLGCETKSISYSGGQSDEVDTTTLCSTAKEFELGLSDSGEMTFEKNYNPKNPGHKAIVAAAADKKKRYILVTFVDGSTFAAIGMVKQRSWSSGVGEVVTSSVNIRLSGDVKETAGSGE